MECTERLETKSKIELSTSPEFCATRKRSSIGQAVLVAFDTATKVSARERHPNISVATTLGIIDPGYALEGILDRRVQVSLQILRGV